MIPNSALLSDCRRYRYLLQRTWVEAAPRLCFVMLNPSTADETEDDATVLRCLARGMMMGFGGVDIVNLFALRATDPRQLYDRAFIVSEPDYVAWNDIVIARSARGAHMVICAWGKHGKLGNRGSWMLDRLREWGIHPHALRLNKDGTPGHPLYISLEQKPFPIGDLHAHP